MQADGWERFLFLKESDCLSPGTDPFVSAMVESGAEPNFAVSLKSVDCFLNMRD